MSGINAKKPISENEFKQQQSATLMELPGGYESNGDLRGQLEDVILYNKGLSYLNNISTTIHDLSLTNVQTAAGQYIIPQNLTWLIIGDKSKVLQGLKEMNWGEVIELDKSGNIIK